MKGRFWVYVYHPNNITTVHQAGCSFCNDGKGLAEKKLDWNGEWHGPFARADAALGLARRSRKKTIRWCAFCARELGIAEPEIRHEQRR